MVSTPPRARRIAISSLLVFAAGVVVADRLVLMPAAAWFAVAAGAAAAAVLARRRVGAVSMGLTLFCLAAGWTTLRIHEPPRHRLDQRVGALPPGQPALVRVEGTVLDDATVRVDPVDPLARRFGDPAGTFRLRVDRVLTDAGPRAVSGELRVFVTGLEPREVRAGATIRVLGLYQPPRPALNPGEPDWQKLARQRGRVGTLRVAGRELIRPAHRPGLISGIRRGLLRARAAARARMMRALGVDPDRTAPADAGSALTLALVLGAREPELDDVGRAFRRTGIAHLLAVSAFHLGVLVGLVLLAARLLGGRGRGEALMIALLVFAYLTLTPARTPVIRAGLMVLALLGAESLGRRYDRLTLLAWLALALLVWRPLDALALGFQLSVGITALLMWMGELDRAWLLGFDVGGAAARPGSPLRAARRRVRQLVSSCVACSAVSTPIVAVHTGVVAPGAALVTLLAMFPIACIIGAGAGAMLLGVVLPALTPVLTRLTGTLSGWVARGMLAIERVPGATLPLMPGSLPWAAATLAVVLVWIRHTGWRARPSLWLATGAVVLWSLWLVLVPARSGPLRVDMLAVGDGSCYLIRSGTDAMLWDCGSSRSSAGDDLIPRACAALGAGRVTTAVVTHPNVDHFNALPAAARWLGLRRVLTTPTTLARERDDPDGPVADALARLRAQGVAIVAVRAGYRERLGRATLTFLWPPERPIERGLVAQTNDTSLVARIDVPTERGPVRVLMTGDIQRAAMAHLLERPAEVAADAIELPHHGSFQDTSLIFVRAVDPSVVLQSTGPSRLGDERWHPARHGRRWHSTAAAGAAWVEVRPDGRVLSGSRLGP